MFGLKFFSHLIDWFLSFVPALYHNDLYFSNQAKIGRNFGDAFGSDKTCFCLSLSSVFDIISIYVRVNGGW